jgi:hypothetical protein
MAYVRTRGARYADGLDIEPQWPQEVMADLRPSGREAAQYDAVPNHVHGHNCGRPFTWLISPNVTKPEAAQTAR